MGLFSKGLVIGGTFEDNKNSLKHDDNNIINSLKQLTVTVHGLKFGRAYYR